MTIIEKEDNQTKNFLDTNGNFSVLFCDLFVARPDY